MKKTGLLFISAVLMLSITLSGCGSANTAQQFTGSANPAQQSTGPSDIQKGGTVRYAVWSSPKGVFLPPLSNDSYNFDTIDLVFEPLLKMNPKQEYEPCLATSYDISPGSKTITFHLRHDVKWHDGQPFTADDVQYTFEFIGSADYTGPYGSFIQPIKGADAFKKGQTQHIEGIKITDPYTISITTDQIYSNAIMNYGYKIRIIPKHIWEKVGPKNADQATDLLRNPIGTGPFKMSKFVPDQYVELVANDAYWNGRPNIDKFLIQVSNQDTAQAQMLNGDIDYMSLSQMNKDDLALYKAKGLQVMEVHGTTYQYMAVNSENSVLNDVKVRQAFAYAINREAMVKDILNGYGEITDCPYRPDFWANPGGLNEYKYNPQKAIELLKQAGWEYKENEKKMYIKVQPAKFSLIYPTGDKAREAAALVVQQNLKDIGIQVDLQMMEFNSVMKKLQSGDFELSLMGMGGTVGDPDIMRFYGSQYVPTKGYNFDHYNNQKVDQLLAKGQQFIKNEDRKPIYNKAAKILNEEQPVVFLYFPNQGRVINSKLKGVQPFPGSNFYNIEKWYFAK